LPEVETTLSDLSLRAEPLVVKLPRQPNSRESRFAHLLGGDINVEELAASITEKNESPASSSRGGGERIARLEEEVAVLQRELAELKQQFAEFRKQFE
jgi:uncharacterized protein YceH (UPF0502 family)